MAYGNRLHKIIYNLSPYWAKCRIASYYARRACLLKYGRFFEKYFKGLEESQWYSTDKLLELQFKKLKQFIKYAYENVTFYNELFKKVRFDPDKNLKDYEDIRKISLLDKETVRQNLDKLRSVNYSKRNIMTLHTSGTTGKSLTIYLSNECYQREYAFNWLHRSWGGIRRGDRIATIGSHPVAPINKMTPPFWVRNDYENQLLFSSYHITKENLKYYIEELEKFQPKFIHGFPSSIYLLASFIEDNSINGIRPECIFLSSETLLDYQRAVIEEAFDCKVFMWYGNTEIVANIVECEHGRLHIKHEHSYIEFLGKNDNPVDFGEEGRMVCTGFGNYAMPLIRYDVGDVAIPINESCPCGRGGMLVKKVVGRVEDYIITPDGRYIGRLDNIFKETPHVFEAQIIQKELSKITLNIVPHRGYTKKEEKNILKEARNKLGNQIEIEIKLVKEIPRLPNGKFPFIVSKLGKPSNLKSLNI